MRKTLLIAAALCLSASAMAQTFEKPLSVSEGNNIYSAPQAGDVYWKFTADQDYIATVGFYDGGEHPSEAILKDGTAKPTNISGTFTPDYDGKIYAFEKGKTYYFILEAKGAVELGFTLKLEATKNIGKGLTEADPLEIKLGETQVSATRHTKEQVLSPPMPPIRLRKPDSFRSRQNRTITRQL